MHRTRPVNVAVPESGTLPHAALDKLVKAIVPAENESAMTTALTETTSDGHADTSPPAASVRTTLNGGSVAPGPSASSRAGVADCEAGGVSPFGDVLLLARSQAPVHCGKINATVASSEAAKPPERDAALPIAVTLDRVSDAREEEEEAEVNMMHAPVVAALPAISTDASVRDVPGDSEKPPPAGAEQFDTALFETTAVAGSAGEGGDASGAATSSRRPEAGGGAGAAEEGNDSSHTPPPVPPAAHAVKLVLEIKNATAP